MFLYESVWDGQNDWPRLVERQDVYDSLKAFEKEGKKAAQQALDFFHQKEIQRFLSEKCCCPEKPKS